MSEPTEDAVLAAATGEILGKIPELSGWVDDLNRELARVQSVADASVARAEAARPDSLWGGSLERALGRAVIAAHETVADSQSDAAEILESARAQAEAILAAASEHAEAILAQARSDANALASAAREAIADLTEHARALEERAAAPVNLTPQPQ